MSEQLNSPAEPVMPEPRYPAPEEPGAPDQAPGTQGESVPPNTSPQTPEVPDLERKRKRRDFWIGFGGWWIANILISFMYILLPAIFLNLSPDLETSSAFNILWLILSIVWLIGNIVALIILAYKRPQIAKGVGVAFASAFALSILAGLSLTALCLILLAGANY